MKIDSSVPRASKSRTNYLYISNHRSYADYVVLAIYLDRVVVEAPASKPLHKIFNWTTTLKNGIYLAEEVPSAGTALLNWAKQKKLDFLDDRDIEVFPICTKVNTMVPLEVSTIYSTWFWDIFTMLFMPITMYEVSSTQPSTMKLREDETTGQFVDRIRLAMSTAANLPLTSTSIRDKKDLLKRYDLDERQAEYAPTLTSLEEPAGNGRRRIQRAPGSDLEIESLVKVFDNKFTEAEVEVVYRHQGGSFEKAMTSLLEIQKKKIQQQKSKSVEKVDEGTSSKSEDPKVKPDYLTQNPIKKDMTLKERRQALFDFCRANYIHKHGSI